MPRKYRPRSDARFAEGHFRHTSRDIHAGDQARYARAREVLAALARVGRPGPPITDLSYDPDLYRVTIFGSSAEDPHKLFAREVRIGHDLDEDAIVALIEAAVAAILESRRGSLSAGQLLSDRTDPDHPEPTRLRLSDQETPK